MQSADILNRDMADNNIIIDANGTTLFKTNSNVTASGNNLFSPEVRIYFLNMYPYHARRVLCAVSV